VFTQLHNAWWLGRYLPARRRLLEQDPEWVAADTALVKSLSQDDDLNAWISAMMLKSEIEQRLVPLEPWPERVWKRVELHKFCVGLYAARADRRETFWFIKRTKVDERVWTVGAWVAAQAAGTIASAWRIAHGLGDTGEGDWPEWQEILAHNNDPPTTCVSYANGSSKACSPQCAAPQPGKVTCLRPRQRTR
jgi:hypothetical protein